MATSEILKHNYLNGWGLFLLFSLPMSGFIGAEAVKTDLATGEGISHMIGYAVRWGIPFIYAVVAASSAAILFPSPFTKWWARNRKFIGLSFAVAMGWQGLFILIVSTVFREHYYGNIYYFRDELEGTVGYIFLAGMVITSFQLGRKYVSAQQWKLIQKGGVYFLWAYPFSVYWWNIFYYPVLDPTAEPRLLDYVLYGAGFLAFAARIAAWGKTRLQKRARLQADFETPFAGKLAGWILIASGLLGSVSGQVWQPSVSGLFEGLPIPFLAEMPLWLPFWPLEPFLPLIVIGLGTSALTAAPQGPSRSPNGEQATGSA